MNQDKVYFVTLIFSTPGTPWYTMNNVYEVIKIVVMKMTSAWFTQMQGLGQELLDGNFSWEWKGNVDVNMLVRAECVRCPWAAGRNVGGH